MAILGVRREDKSPWERRAPLVPEDVAQLVTRGVEVHVQTAPNRCFADDDYRRGGARIVSSLDEADVVLGVKEVPIAELRPGKTYMFFSHTIKGQPHNMPMLRRMLDLGCSLLDYELVTDDAGVRTIAFGRHAGIAGVLDTLWLLGRRLHAEGIRSPLADLRQTVEYRDLEDATVALRAAGAGIAAGGWPRELGPPVIAITGEGGKVWGGALEILDLLPSRRVAPRDLAPAAAAADGREILVVSYGPGDLVEPVDPGAAYSWEDYRDRPSGYRARFGADLPHLTAIVHGIFWREGYPRFILKDDVQRLFAAAVPPRLRVIADITCDLGGSDECLVKSTDPGNPAYVWDPDTGDAHDGWEGRGPVVLAVDILPSELPVEASRHFSRVLSPLVPPLVNGTPDASDYGWPATLMRALMAHRGTLREPWAGKLSGPLQEHGGAPPPRGGPS